MKNNVEFDNILSDSKQNLISVCLTIQFTDLRMAGNPVSHIQFSMRGSLDGARVVESRAQCNRSDTRK